MALLPEVQMHSMGEGEGSAPFGLAHTAEEDLTWYQKVVLFLYSTTLGNIIFSACLVTVAVLLSAACIGAIEKWSFGESIYFSIISYSTIGFGDIAPNSTGGRVFVSLFAFGLGLPSMGFLISSAGSLGDDQMQYAIRKGRSRMLRLDFLLSCLSSLSRLSHVSLISSLSRLPRRLIDRWIALAWLIFYLGSALLASLLLAIAEGFDIGTSVFVIWQCSTTIGYGTHPPVTPGGRAVCCTFGVVNIFVLGFLLTRVTKIIFHPHKRARKYLERNRTKPVRQALERFLVSHKVECETSELDQLVGEIMDS